MTNNNTVEPYDSNICRICFSDRVNEVISFGKQPNTFNLLKSIDEEYHVHDLTLCKCNRCGFVFIKNPMPAEMFYQNYKWPTSINPPPHTNWMCDNAIAQTSLSKEDFILDIGSNDGLLLNTFKVKGFNNVLGIEPSEDCTEKAKSRGITTINGYFNESIADGIRNKSGIPKLIFCIQVLEHVSDIDIFIRDISNLMNNDTLLIIEVPNFANIAAQGDFTSIWEQHINYFTIDTIEIVLNRYELSIYRDFCLPYSGGSLLLFIKKNLDNCSKKSVNDKYNFSEQFNNNLKKNMDEFKALLERIKKDNKKLVAYGAGAKGSCLINLSKTKDYFDYIIDDNIDKLGYYLPGSHLKVQSSASLVEDKPDYCLIAPLNDKNIELKIIERNADYIKKNGHFIRIYPYGYEIPRFLGLDL